MLDCISLWGFQAALNIWNKICVAHYSIFWIELAGFNRIVANRSHGVAVVRSSWLVEPPSRGVKEAVCSLRSVNTSLGHVGCPCWTPECSTYLGTGQSSTFEVLELCCNVSLALIRRSRPRCRQSVFPAHHCLILFTVGWSVWQFDCFRQHFNQVVWLFPDILVKTANS